MANVNVAAYKTLGAGFSNEEKTAKLTWAFSDGGATTDVYRLATTGRKILVLDATVHVETACTSGGSATFKIGATSADDDAFLDTTSGAVASMVDDYVVRETTSALVVGSGDFIALVIGTAAATAGKVNVFLRYRNID